jgi:hypothetical protein
LDHTIGNPRNRKKEGVLDGPKEGMKIDYGTIRKFLGFPFKIYIFHG